MQNRTWCVMGKLCFLVIVSFIQLQTMAQQPPISKPPLDIDTTINYDDFFSELDHFFDSLYAPHSFALINVGVTSNFYNYNNPANNKIKTLEKVTFNPSLAYYHKSGLGISMSAFIIDEKGQYTPYQYAASGSYDYIKNRKWASGATFTHFFTKENLTFYTSPLENTGSAYFTYRKWWVRPTVTMNYGWGSRDSYSHTSELVKRLKLKKKPLRNVTNTTTTSSHEDVSDFTVAASVKHDFYWLNVVSKKDFFRLTPQLTFTSGTQRFGFNQSSTSAVSSSTGVNLLTSSKSMYLDNKGEYQPLAVTAFIKTEFSIGKFFVQPQVVVDYYLPSPNDNLSTTYALNTGFIF